MSDLGEHEGTEIIEPLTVPEPEPVREPVPA